MSPGQILEKKTLLLPLRPLVLLYLENIKIVNVDNKEAEFESGSCASKNSSSGQISRVKC